MGTLKYGVLGVLAVLALGVAVQCSSDEPASQVQAPCLINSDCSNPLSCTFGRCHNQCKATGDCPLPQHCVKTVGDFGVCQFPDEVKCIRNSDCSAPLVCATDSHCRNQCKTERDCFPEQTCAAGGYCAEKNEVTADNRLLGEDGGASTDGAASSEGGSGTDDGGSNDANVSELGAPGDATAPDATSDSKAPGDAAVEAGPLGAKLYIRTGSSLLVYTLDQLTVDNTGPAPRVTINGFGLFGFVVDLDGNAWGYVGSGWMGRLLASDLAASGNVPSTPEMHVFVRSSNGQRAGVDGLGNLWTAGPGVVNRVDRAGLSTTNVVANIIQGFTSELSVKYPGTLNGAPGGILFDSEGTLLIVETGALHRFTPDLLTGSGAKNDPPSSEITLANAAVRVNGVNSATVAPNGDFWYVCGSTTPAICRLDKATLAAGGSINAATTTLSVAAFTPQSLVFDPDGNLWIDSTTKLIKLAKADLDNASGDAGVVTPAVRINPPAGNAQAFGEMAIGAKP
jgi:hypothetical protein